MPDPPQGVGVPRPSVGDDREVPRRQLRAQLHVGVPHQFAVRHLGTERPAPAGADGGVVGEGVVGKSVVGEGEPYSVKPLSHYIKV